VTFRVVVVADSGENTGRDGSDLLRRTRGVITCANAPGSVDTVAIL
jgi:hypothetical protein